VAAEARPQLLANLSAAAGAGKRLVLLPENNVTIAGDGGVKMSAAGRRIIT
jgi:hypothetical protein